MFFVTGSYLNNVRHDVSFATVPLFFNASGQVRTCMIMLIRDRLIEVQLTPYEWNPG